MGWGEDMDPDMEGPDCCEGWPGVVRFGFPLKFPCLARKMKCGLLQCSYTLEKLLLAQGFRLCCGAARLARQAWLKEWPEMGITLEDAHTPSHSTTPTDSV